MAKDLMINDEIFMIYFQSRGLKSFHRILPQSLLPGSEMYANAFLLMETLRASSTSRFIMVDDYIDDSVFR